MGLSYQKIAKFPRIGGFMGGQENWEQKERFTTLLSCLYMGNLA